MHARFQVIVLGIVQDGGFPQLGCQGECCAEARRTGRRETQACLGVYDPHTGARLLIEATPSIEDQVARLAAVSGGWGDGGKARPRKPVDGILLTHAHMGHYTGLLHLGREGASVTEMPVFASKRMTRFLRENQPWRQLLDLGQIVLRPIAPGRRFFPIEGLGVVSIAVPHRGELADTLAFRLEGPESSVLFLPDIDGWEESDSAGRKGHGLRRVAPPNLSELVAGVDVAFLDGTFYDGSEFPGRDLDEIPHPLMVDTMDRLEERVHERPGSLRFIHLNHSNPALYDPRRRGLVEERGFGIARAGDVLHL